MNDWIKKLNRGTTGRILMLETDDAEAARGHVIAEARRINRNIGAMGLIDHTGSIQARSERILAFIQRVGRAQGGNAIVWVQRPDHLFVRAIGGHETAMEAGVWALRGILDAALPNHCDVIIAGDTRREIETAAKAMRSYDRAEYLQLGLHAAAT